MRNINFQEYFLCELSYHLLFFEKPLRAAYKPPSEVQRTEEMEEEVSPCTSPFDMHGMYGLPTIEAGFVHRWVCNKHRCFSFSRTGDPRGHPPRLSRLM